MSYKLNRKDEKELVNKLIEKKLKNWTLYSSNILMQGNLPVKIGFYGQITLEYGISTINLRLISRIKLYKHFNKTFKQCKKEFARIIYKNSMKGM